MVAVYPSTAQYNYDLIVSIYVHTCTGSVPSYHHALLEPVYQHKLTEISTWLSNHTHDFCVVYLLIHDLISTAGYLTKLCDYLIMSKFQLTYGGRWPPGYLMITQYGCNYFKGSVDYECNHVYLRVFVALNFRYVFANTVIIRNGRRDLMRHLGILIVSVTNLERIEGSMNNTGKRV